MIVQMCLWSQDLQLEVGLRLFLPTLGAITKAFCQELSMRPLTNQPHNSGNAAPLAENCMHTVTEMRHSPCTNGDQECFTSLQVQADMYTLHNAIEKRNYLQFDILVSQKIGLDKLDSRALTPLMKCCHEPNKDNADEMVRLLLLQKAKTEKVDKRGRNVLMHAALVGNNKIVKRLLEHADFDATNRDFFGNAPLHYAAMSGDIESIDILSQELLDSKLKPDLRNDDGFTPIMMAASQGHLKAARFLHSIGASLTYRDAKYERDPRGWVAHVLDVPPFVDPFGPSTNPDDIFPHSYLADEEEDDNLDVRLFVYMKETPDIDKDQLFGKPPWDSSTNIKNPPRKVRQKQFVNKKLTRPASSIQRVQCHYQGPSIPRPFSAPCNLQDLQKLRSPYDVQKLLTVPELDNFRSYDSARDLAMSETEPVLRKAMDRMWKMDEMQRL